MFKKQSGFTLIELIVVIVILGILAATALPKFMGIQGGARASILQGARGSVASAMNIAYATQQALGLTSSTGVTLDGISILMVNKYPQAGYIYSAAGLSADFSAVVNNPNTGTGTAIIKVLNATNPSTCAFTYTEASASAPPSITVITPDTAAGC